jgi:hypothetical protein
MRYISEPIAQDTVSFLPRQCRGGQAHHLAWVLSLTILSVLSGLENSAMLRYHCVVVPVEAPLTTIMVPAESLPVCGLLGSID